jgi:hypothetical protein
MNAKLNNTVANYMSKVEQHIDANTKLGEAMQDLKPMYDKASKVEQDEIHNLVAKLIGKKYKATPKLMEKGINKGLLGFDAHGTEQESKARDALRYYLPKQVVGKSPTKTTRKSVDKVEALLAEFYALSKREQARFDSLRAKDAK